jgi:Ser/Thr protein kinase RdoA (MazF antagonist)
VDETPEVLQGGNASGPVVRIGETVRKPREISTSVVHAYLSFLKDRGIDVPRALGRDDQDRQILEFVPGESALQLMPLENWRLREVGLLVRRIHDASAQFDIRDLDFRGLLPPVGEVDLMCHNDLAPWNLILGERSIFIDWDSAAPSTRLWDLAYAAQSFGMLVAGEPVDVAAARLATFIDAYEADRSLRTALPAAMADRTRAMCEMLSRAHREGREPWATMFVEGHGEFWRAASEYVVHNQSAWVRALA